MIEPEILALFTTENFALFCTSTVSVIAVLATVHQTKIHKETELSKTYYEHQVKIYGEFYEAAVNFDIQSFSIENYNALMAASQKAKLVSNVQTSLLIDKFCTFCAEHSNQADRNDPDIIKTFTCKRMMMENALREELYYYRPKRKLRKRFSLKLRSSFQGSQPRKPSK